MKLGPMRFSAASLTLMVIQLALVCSIAAKYLYQRWTCPRVWTRTVAYDPELLMRGRYLSLQLTVDGCQSTLPSAKHAEFPRDYNGAAVSGNFMVRGEAEVAFPAELKVVDNRLAAVYIRDAGKGRSGQAVMAVHGSPCDQMRRWLEEPNCGLKSQFLPRGRHVRSNWRSRRKASGSRWNCSKQ